METSRKKQRSVELVSWAPGNCVPSGFREDSMYMKKIQDIENGTVSAKFKLEKSVRIANEAIQKMIDSCG